jgi:AcrR family transcriptional regulator
MARRKDHSPQQLKEMIRTAAEKLIYKKGLDGLTARALAQTIGYAPGTIYNFYKDMDTLITDINYETLGHLFDLCQTRIEKSQPGFAKIKALAYAYIDFAHGHKRAWETLFAASRANDKKTRLPPHYQARLLKLFTLIEFTLQESLSMSRKEAGASARLLWACMHGITMLTLEGRLALVGAPDPHVMIDHFLQKYLSQHLSA